MNDYRISDRDLRAAFAARAAGPPSPDLAARISAGAARTRQSRPLIVLPGFVPQAPARLAWAAVLAALTIALIGVLAFGVGNRNPITSVAPSPSPASSLAPIASPSADPSVEPSPSVGPAPSAQPSPFVPADLGPDRIGRVVATDGLRVRSLPTVGESSARRDPLLPQGTKFYVVDGPVMADGYAWYQVDPYGSDSPLPFGWVAAGSRDGEAWIENLFDDCDSIGPTIQLLGEKPAQENLFCYGVVMPGDIELTGNLVCEFANVEPTFSGPDWVESDRTCELRAPDFNIHDGISFRVVGQAATGLLEPGSQMPVDGQYRVVGHFDDPQSSECVSAGSFGSAPPDPAEIVLNCRMQFVVTEVTPAP